MLAAGCGKPNSLPPDGVKKPAPPVMVTEARRGELVERVTYTGFVEPVRVARMASPAEGPIVECAVREGDRVETGQRLARVGRSRMADVALEAAQEEWRRQKAEFDRVARLVESGSLAGEELDSARASLKRAEAQVAAMETGKADYDIVAPWAGIVSKVWIAEGDYVAPRARLVELFDPASLVIRFSVPERDLPALRLDLNVKVTLDAYPERTFAAVITRVFPELDPATQTGTVEAKLREDVKLWRGMFARIETPLRALKDAVVVPDGAVVVLPNGEPVVFVISDGKAMLRKVRIAMEAGGRLAIESGVEAGEMVVVRGNESLRNGMAVRAMDAAAKAGPDKPGPAGQSGGPEAGAGGKAMSRP